MNCEKCKSRKATLFYADEGGGRHALCASCGATRDKLGKLPVTEDEEKSSYLPEITLTDLLPRLSPTPLYISLPRSDLTCHRCKLTLEGLLENGHTGCPQCYDVFGELLFPIPEPASPDARMPAERRKRLDREATIVLLRQELKAAVESESYEQAASLRDKIKKLEAPTP